MTLNTNLSTQRLNAKGGARRLVASFARPANTTAYTAGDVINESTSATVIGFTEAGVGGKIVGASIIMEETDTANLQVIVFDEEPTNFADNSALALVASDDDKVVGVFNLTEARKFNLGTNREFYRTDVGASEYTYTSTDGKLFALLVTRSGFTPITGSGYTINLHVESND